MLYRNRRVNYNSFIWMFVAVKVAINLLAISHFGFHRDELLHLALGDHLDWGYKEVPPFIALLAKITTTVFGSSLIATRIFSTICSGLIVWLTGRLTVELGGRKFAIALACLSIIISPAFAASGYLFQPVVFDQFWWVLSAWLLVKYLNTNEPRYIYWLGAAVGFGLLTKYTMAFFALALIGGLLISKQRKILFNRHVLTSAFIALLLFIPNIIWQFTHHLPVVHHMEELRSSQLHNISPADFIMQQVLVNGTGLFLWIAGFIYLLFSFRLRKFQFLAYAFVFIFIFLIVMNGKSYYLFGAYPMLFAGGAYVFEKWLKTWGKTFKLVVAFLLIAPNLLLFPIVLPIFSIDQTLAIFKYTNKNMPFLHFATTWEDQKLHPLTQDYADMFGWDEMAQKVAKAYHELTPDEKKQTVIFADNYGQAGAIQHYGKQLQLPTVVCLNSSFALWAPDELSAKHMIYVSDDANIDDLIPLTGSYKLLSVVENPNAREKGTAIFILRDIKPELNKVYGQDLSKKRKQ